MEASVVFFSCNDGAHRGNHRNLLPCGFEDLVDKLRGRRLAVGTRHPDHRELPTGKVKPENRQYGNNEVIEPLEATNHTLIIPRMSVKTQS